VNGTSQGIRASVYDANGIVVAGNILVNQFNQAGTQLSNDVTALPDGGFAVVWEDVAAGVDRVQRFDAAGNLLGTPVTISNLATIDVNAATLTGGRSIFTINDFSSGDNNTVSAILIDPQANDYTDNGLSDILWRNDNGQLALWDMGNNGTIAGSGLLPVSPDANWSRAAFDDFNGDGRSDLVWRNISGATALWTMNGTSLTSSSSFTAGGNPVNPDPSWSIAGAEDFNGDGKSDLLWRNTAGSLVEWILNGST